MAFFRCEKCGCQEDTALCKYWSARIQETPPPCSACDPKIAKWHAEFPRKYQGVSQGEPAEGVKVRTTVLDVAVESADDARRMIYVALSLAP